MNLIRDDHMRHSTQPTSGALKMVLYMYMVINSSAKFVWNAKRYQQIKIEIGISNQRCTKVKIPHVWNLLNHAYHVTLPVNTTTDTKLSIQF